MSNIDKHAVQAVADLKAGYTLGHADVAILNELARIALASLEVEPVISHLGSKNALDAIVAFIKSNRNPTLKDYNEVSERLFQDNCHGLSNHVIEYIKQIGEELEELRSTQDTAPPAPEFYKIGDATMRHIFTPTGITDVSDMQAVFDQIETVLAGMWQPAPVSVPDAMDGQGGVCCEVSYADGWNSCRAAMLQNGNSPAQSDCCPAQNCIAPALGGNSPVIADGWVACSERMPEQFVEVLVCTEDGSRYVAALNQSMNWDDGDFFDDIQYVTHWMPLPAAPQQEV